jgi:hypothetical protein
MRRSAVLLAALTAAAAASASAQQTVTQERLDLAALQRIREEGLTRSRVDTFAMQLMDSIGPRLTASSGMRRGQQWAAATMRAMGLVSVQVEPWDTVFGRGWDHVGMSARMLEPFAMPVNAFPQAWSGSTRGTLTCPVTAVEIQDTTDFARYEGRLRGQCVLRQAPRDIGPEWNAYERRWDADSLIAWAQRQPEAPRQGPPQGQPPAAVQQRMRMFQLQNRVAQWLTTQGVAAILAPSNATYGMLTVSGGPQSAGVRNGTVTDPLPALVVAHEQYGLMWRNVKRGIPVRLELNVQNRIVNSDGREYNVVGDIPGTDLANQMVMIGAHFDSWHGGTGATDNGAGSVVMLEAMRILRALNLPLRRTVRIALWSGEEQGLIGSNRYVRAHMAEMPNVSAYLNVDNGTGRIRGVYTQSNPAVLPIWEQILSPFRDLGVVASNNQNTGGTDHLSFDRLAGVPGFQFIQDQIEYDIRTHHFNTDTYERLVMDDLRQMATIVAWSVYTIANRDEMMPRKAAPQRAAN